MRFLCSLLGLLVTIRPIVSVVFAVARSKFRQRQYLLTQFTVLLLLQILFLTYSLTRGRPWRYSVIPSTPDFPTEYQIRRHSNPAGLPTFAAVSGPDFRASIIRLTCPHVFKQIKKNYFDDDVQSQSSPTKLRRPMLVIGMQRRGTRADSHRRLLVVYSARGFLAPIVCFEGATPAFQS